MGRTLYLECNSGISGDMTAAALLDLGADPEVLRRALKSLPVPGFDIGISRVKKAGLDVCDFRVCLDAEHENHDHDMEYLYGHNHGQQKAAQGHYHEHRHEEEDCHGEHCHEEEHEEDHHESAGNGQETEQYHEHHHSAKGHTHGHHHEHRGLPEILNIIEHSEISSRAKATAVRIFQILAQAEARAHGVPQEQVHFHEVGAVDSIVDIIAAAVCLDNLDITEVIVPYLCEGRGTVRCQHGILPVPVPAVAHIAQEHRIALQITNLEGELVTPTGAAIVAAVRTSEVLPERFVIERVGTGAGKRNYERPSLLRAMLIRGEEAEREDTVWKLESNIDDCTGEVFGYVMQRLLEAGARDVFYTPVFTKKNRPAYQLTVLCDENKRNELEQIIFQETTTIGIRRARMERTVLPREAGSAALSFGELKVKKCILPDGKKRCYPEYESAVRLAEENGVSIQQVLKAFQEYDADGK